VVSMAMDRCGCQYLSVVKNRLCELMTHPFGNYLIQKIFQARSDVTWE